MIYDYIFKIIIVGDTGCGKSCLLLHFTYKLFEPVHYLTIGMEFGSRIINVLDKKIKIVVYDSAGQEIFRSIMKSYYRGSSIAILVYDITRRETFNSIQEWIRETDENADKLVTIVLVGNKKDLEHMREVTKKEGEELAKKEGILFYETSAKSGENVYNIFSDPSERLLNEIMIGEIDIENFDCLGIKINKSESSKSENIKYLCCSI